MKKIAEMPDNARVWIYISNRALTAAEVDTMNHSAAEFLIDWTSHGASMDAAFEVVHDRIAIIAADESKAMASGCGIDKSVNFMKSAGTALGVDFFKRTIIIYSTGTGWEQKELHEFWAMRKAGLINDATVLIDNTVKTVGEFRKAFEKKFSESWHAEMWVR